jgi:hypothetical protein
MVEQVFTSAFEKRQLCFEVNDLSPRSVEFDEFWSMSGWARIAGF